MRIPAGRWWWPWPLVAVAALLPARALRAEPVCDAGGPYSMFLGAPVQFDGSGSHAPGGVIVSYVWSFGDGTTATGPTPVHFYMTIDLFTVMLTVTDDTNATNSCTTTADIYGEIGPPVCDAGGPYYGSVAIPIQFDGTRSSAPEGAIVSYEWHFDDGAVGSGPTPEHAYAIGGYYTVTLVVTDDDGATSACETTAAVTPLAVEPVTWGAVKTLYR